VFPAEVEDLISGHPDVVEATAMGVEDQEYGARLRAFVVKQQDSALDEDAVKSYVKEHLARYKVPREVIFLDELPRNPTGKILKRELRDIDVDGDVDAQVEKASGDAKSEKASDEAESDGADAKA